MSLRFQFVTNQVAATLDITHNNRAYLVAPVVALREGVLNDVLVLASEFGRFVDAWNGRPVTLGHPQIDGQYVSANSPDIWATEVPGFLWNARLDGDALKGEIWIDLARATEIGERALSVVNSLREGEPMEVSTGYFADVEDTKGAYNGRAYIAIARNIRPDHLALLPDEIGACSWEDGCGTPRVNNRREGLNVNALDLDDKLLAVRRAFWQFAMSAAQSDEIPDLSLVALFDDTVIAKDWMTMSHVAYPYTMADDGTVTFGEPVAVEVVYRAKEGGAEVVIANAAPAHRCSCQKESGMTKGQLVAELTANARCKFSRERLEAMEQEDLIALHESLTANEEEAQADVEGDAEVTLKVDAPELPADVLALAGLVQELGGVDKLSDALSQVTANADAERNSLIDSIMANERNTFEEAELRQFTVAQLRKLNESLAPRNYMGAAGTFRNSRGAEPAEEVLAMPWTVAKEGK